MSFPIRQGLLGSFTATATGTARNIADSDEGYCYVGGTFVGTVAIEVSPDAGTTWIQFGASLTAPGITAVLPPATLVRAKCTAFTSGTILVAFGGRDKAPGQS
jgi:hypothetical protein